MRKFARERTRIDFGQRMMYIITFWENRTIDSNCLEEQCWKVSSHLLLLLFQLLKGIALQMSAEETTVVDDWKLGETNSYRIVMWI